MARLFAKAEHVRGALGLPLSPPERREHTTHRDMVRAALGKDRFTEAWAEGRMKTREQAIEYALGDGT